MSTAALQYAAALQETGCTLAQLDAAAAYLTGSAPLWEALCSPAVEANEKVAVLRRLPDFPGEGKLQDFLTVLARRGRFPLLPSIVAQYRQLKRREAGEGLCLLRCARDPGDQALAPVAQFLCKKHGYQAITFEIVVDPEVLGGFVLEIDGVTYDKSVRGQLQALAQSLQKG